MEGGFALSVLVSFHCGLNRPLGTVLLVDRKYDFVSGLSCFVAR